MQSNQSKYAFFTIDVERFIDTECIRNANQPIEETMLDGLDRYMEILDKHNIKATMFLLSDIAEDIMPQIKKHLANGHKIALHGKEHIAPLLITDDQFREQTRSAKEKLEKMFDIPIEGYRAPCFSMDCDKIKILQELGFLYDSSRIKFSAARHTVHMPMDNYDNITGEIYRTKNFYEFGLSSQKIFGKNFPISGGGYIRISNWLFARTLLKHYIKNNDYYMFYLHPFELSQKKRPKVNKLKFYDKMYVGYGYRTFPLKIEYIIKCLKKAGYIFTTFEDMIAKNRKKTKYLEV